VCVRSNYQHKIILINSFITTLLSICEELIKARFFICNTLDKLQISDFAYDIVERRWSRFIHDTLSYSLRLFYLPSNNPLYSLFFILTKAAARNETVLPNAETEMVKLGLGKLVNSEIPKLSRNAETKPKL
jgi:hypothetical protein